MKKSSPLKLNNNEWLAACAHELRIPIAQIHACTQILDLDAKENFLSQEEHAQYMQDIIIANQNLDNLVEDFIGAAKAARHEFSVKNQAVDLFELLHQSYHGLAIQTKDGVSLTLDFPDDIPKMVQGDPQRIQQVIANLLRNAMKFTEQGSIHIQVTEAEHNSLQIAIIDTGIGMEPEKLDNIWHTFTQVHNDKLNNDHDIGQGLGIGLAIVKNLVEAMDGRISVESRVGHGSKFYFTLPTT